MPPMLREEPGVLALGKAVVEEQHHALIFLRPDDPPGGLQDLSLIHIYSTTRAVCVGL